MHLREEVAKLTPMARRYARALVSAEGDRTEIADQIVQEAVLRVLRGDWSGRHSTLRVSLFVSITALNRARLRARSAPRSAAEEPNARPSPFWAARGGVTQALERLANEEREALLLVAVEELDYAQVCEILNVPRPALIARLARARLAFGEALEISQVPEKMRRAQTPHLRLVK